MRKYLGTPVASRTEEEKENKKEENENKKGEEEEDVEIIERIKEVEKLPSDLPKREKKEEKKEEEGDSPILIYVISLLVLSAGGIFILKKVKNKGEIKNETKPRPRKEPKSRYSSLSDY